MNFKIYHVLVVFFGLFFLVGNAEAKTAPLPECSEAACSEIFHNKELGQATLIAWDGKGNILKSHTFDLDSSAVLTFVSKSDGIVSEMHNNATSNNAPPPPCAVGSCSVSHTSTYVTATHIVMVVTTFTYFNGQLIGVNIAESKIGKPSEIER